MFSVVIPVYNRRALVGRAIRSVLTQQGVDFEVIVVDDASDDGTPEQVREEFGDAVKIVSLGSKQRGLRRAQSRDRGSRRRVDCLYSTRTTSGCPTNSHAKQRPYARADC